MGRLRSRIASKMSANEASAVATLRTLNTSTVAYSTTYGAYPTNLADLGPSGSPTSTAADLIDSMLAKDPATKSGYTFNWSGTASSGVISSYTLTAKRLTQGVTGQRGVMRADVTGTASVSSTPLS